MLDFRRIFIVLALELLISTAMFAQQLQVSYVVGRVTSGLKNQEKRVNINDVLTYESIVSIPVEGKLELVDKQNKQKITLHKPGANKIKELSKVEGNKITQLSAKYLSYLAKQLTNKDLVSKQRLTDFATVTRDLNVAEEDDALADLRNAFRKGVAEYNNRFTSYKDSINAAYRDFVKKSWLEVRAQAKLKRPKEDANPPSTFNSQGGELASIKLSHQVSGWSNPDGYINSESVNPAYIPTEKELELDDRLNDELYGNQFPFTFYGTSMEVRLTEDMRFNIGNIVPDNLIEALSFFNNSRFDNLFFDCEQLKKKHNLCDWAYILMIKGICDDFLGVDSNEANLLLGYLLGQSGFKLRFAKDDSHLYVLLASKHRIFELSYFVFEDEYYYSVTETPEQLSFCQACYPKENCFSLFFKKPLHLDNKASNNRTIRSAKYPDISLSVAYNQNLLDFYNDYPVSYIGNELQSKWLVYFSKPFDDSTHSEIKKLISSLSRFSQTEKIEVLLNLVQTGLDYKTDEEVWGSDRVFFSDETIAYPYSDCEDRAILFANLVHEITGLKCVLLFYPQHLAAAVCLENEVKGYYYEVDGQKYSVCDPSYIGAKVGNLPEQYISSSPMIIKL